MARMVHDVTGQLLGLIELERGAVDALSAASKRLTRLADKVEVGAMMANHRRHLVELEALVRSYGREPGNGGDAPAFAALMSKARILLNAIGGEGALLSALAAIEASVRARYAHASDAAVFPPHVAELCAQHTADLDRHRAWLHARASHREHEAVHV